MGEKSSSLSGAVQTPPSGRRAVTSHAWEGVVLMVYHDHLVTSMVLHHLDELEAARVKYRGFL